VQALLKKLPCDAQVDVITTMPNRYSSFITEVSEFEQSDRFSIRRIALPAHHSGMIDQSRAFLSYAVSALNQVRGRKYDLIFATSSRLMTGVLGSLIARWQRTRLYLDIRDIFVDTIEDVLSKKSILAIRPVLVRLERFALMRAQRVNLVSEGFLDYFQQRYPHLSYSFYTNGVDPEFINKFEASGNAAVESAGRPLTVLYAGNIGEGQGLHAIIPRLAEKMGAQVQFRLIGDGGRRSELERALTASGVHNVEVTGPVSRSCLIEEYRAADVLFLHLNDYDAFKKVLPSKIFEYAATGKPVWAGVSGFSSQFIKREVQNAAVFESCNVDEAVKVFATLDLVSVSRQDFVRRFSRDAISSDLAADVLSTAEMNE